MRSILINYKASKKRKSAEVMLCKYLYGYKDVQQKGKYSYERKGILEKIPYIKVARSVFIIRKEDLNTFLDILKRCGIEYTTREVTLTEKDKKTLHYE